MEILMDLGNGGGCCHLIWPVDLEKDSLGPKIAVILSITSASPRADSLKVPGMAKLHQLAEEFLKRASLGQQEA
jgi:hypothetical protein